MKRLARHLKRLWLPSLLAALVAACADDGYHYPDIRQDFLTFRTDAEGYVRTLLLDDGSIYEVENAVRLNQVTDTTVRAVAKYVIHPQEDAPATALFYSYTRTVSPIPQRPSYFKDGVKTDPVSVQSIWMGLGYLNMVLEVKGTTLADTYHFVQDTVRDCYSSVVSREVHLSLYHDAMDDPPYYTRRAYLSVPLQQYATDGVQAVAVHFSLRNYDGELETYTFEYE